jgi:hypothetical protein
MGGLLSMLVRRTGDLLRDAMVSLPNEDVRLRADHHGHSLKRPRGQMRQLEQQDVNVRRAPRSARPRSTERISLEIETVAAESAEATVPRSRCGRPPSIGASRETMTTTQPTSATKASSTVPSGGATHQHSEYAEHHARRHRCHGSRAINGRGWRHPCGQTCLAPKLCARHVPVERARSPSTRLDPPP